MSITSPDKKGRAIQQLKENIKKINQQALILQIYEKEIQSIDDKEKQKKAFKIIQKIKPSFTHYVNEINRVSAQFLNNVNTLDLKRIETLNERLLKVTQKMTERLATLDPYRPEPFKGYGVRVLKLKPSGAQSKKLESGLYPKKGSKVQYYIKSSGTYLADDVSEVMTSGLLIQTIGRARAVPYDFVASENTGERFVKCPIKPGSRLLSDLVKNQWTGFIATHSANPWTKQNKTLIQQAIKAEHIQRDMAYILAGCLLMKDEDCQVSNIALYKDKENNTRASKFDNGWGLADICTGWGKQVRLFKSKLFFGARATHKPALLPTNHFVDYPEVLHSQDFVDALRDVAVKSKQDSNQKVDALLNKILTNFESKKDKLNALNEFSKHIGLEIPKGLRKQNDPEKIKTLIAGKLTVRLLERAHSMEVLAELMNLKLLKNYPDKKDPLFLVKLQEGLIRLYKITQEYYPGQKFDSFMPPFEAREGFTTLRSGYSAVISDLLKIAKQGNHTLDPACAEFCKRMQGWRNTSQELPGMERLVQESEVRMPAGKRTL